MIAYLMNGKMHFNLIPLMRSKTQRLGTYFIHEEDAPIPNLSKEENDIHGLWDMFIDGSRNKNGAGAGVLLVSPRREKYNFSFRLHFCCTNNVAEYEDLMLGLQTTQRRDIKSLKVHGDSELVVNQIRDQNNTKNNLLKFYKHRT